MTDAVVIREASIDEIVDLHAAIEEFDQEPKSHFEERLAGKKHICFLALSGGKPAGYLVGYDHDVDGSVYCWMTGVHPESRRQGILTRLMESFEVWAREHHYGRITIKTRNNRREMLAYLVKHDFQFLEVERREPPEESRILLQKEI
jgi:ribosomal protein S18 acetylase RimI-like enzyme